MDALKSTNGGREREREETKGEDNAYKHTYNRVCTRFPACKATSDLPYGSTWADDIAMYPNSDCQGLETNA